MNRKERLINELAENVFGKPWHGPSLIQVLKNVDTSKLNSRLNTGMHSIMEYALHILAWTEEVETRLKGGAPKEPAIDDWPDSDAIRLDWHNLIKRISDSSTRIIDELKNFTDERLDEIVGAERNLPLGTGISFESMILGLIQHNAYHSGQIALLNKL